MAIHPHMGKIIAYYDLLIYRYYSPVWNRNGEGKLQALEEEKEDDDDGGDDDDDKKELDRGGLEKGEGVEIVVLKVVPKKKKNKKEKDEENKEKEEEEKETDEKDDGFEDEKKFKK